MALFECNGGGIKQISYGTLPACTTDFQNVDFGFNPDEVWFWFYGTSNKSVMLRFRNFTASSAIYDGITKASSSSAVVANGAVSENCKAISNGITFRCSSTSSAQYGIAAKYVAFKYND